VGDAVWRLAKKSKGLPKEYDLYFSEMAVCPTASIVKPADRAHNIQTMQGVFTREKQVAYVQELDEWFFPMIKVARRRSPEQFAVCENLKILLRCQQELILSLGD